MFHRSVKIPKSRSFFLFGARGTGKSTLIRSQFAPDTSLLINLLDLDQEEQFSRDPMALERQVLAVSPKITHVVIDEIQKIPKLLDVVHHLMETHKVPQSFILTGSSTRKLKAGSANLLAGRAALRNLFPLLREELGSVFEIEVALRWGTLPKVWNTRDEEERRDILRSYAQLYVKEEVWAEQLVRQLDPFRRFLEIAALNSGKIVNYSNIARDVGVDIKTVQSWYSVVEDTLLGFYLDSFHTSARKQLLLSPKFYFFDTGVARALAQMLNVVPAPQTGYYGDLFEQFVICQFQALNQYNNLDYKLHFLLTKSGVEIDLVITRPGKPLALIEIKSSKTAKSEHVSVLEQFLGDFPDAEFFLWSQDPKKQRFGKILALPWWEGILAI